MEQFKKIIPNISPFDINYNRELAGDDWWRAFSSHNPYTSLFWGIKEDQILDLNTSITIEVEGEGWASFYSTPLPTLPPTPTPTPEPTPTPAYVANGFWFIQKGYPQPFKPLEDWELIRARYQFYNGIKTDGTLWEWGIGVENSSPVQTICGGTDWKTVSCGNYHSTAIKTDGTLWGWGDNYNGQLGDSSTVDKSSPVQTVAGGSNWKEVSCGSGDQVMAIKTDGTLWGWGKNYYGTLGNNKDIFNESSPVQTICGGTDWKMVVCGGLFTSAIKTNGTLWTWGSNYNGELGDSTTVLKSSPVQTICGGTDWKMVSCGTYHTAAIKTDGTLWTWGRNYYGELGDSTIINKSSPVQTIVGGTSWKTIYAGSYHTAGIKTDGTLWQFGNYVNSIPTQFMPNTTSWKEVISRHPIVIAKSVND